VCLGIQTLNNSAQYSWRSNGNAGKKRVRFSPLEKASYRADHYVTAAQEREQREAVRISSLEIQRDALRKKIEQCDGEASDLHKQMQLLNDQDKKDKAQFEADKAALGQK
jgi:hypothetical protein